MSLKSRRGSHNLKFGRQTIPDAGGGSATASALSSNKRTELSQGWGVIPHKIHPSPLKLALPAARLGGEPSLPWSPL